ncbi:MAG: N-acetyl-D-Glu racemase DgcA [Alphaproteobacteria bacterium]
MRRLTARAESWPIRGAFTISRGAKTEARVVVVDIAEGDVVGRGECVPYARYGETVDGVLAQMGRLRHDLAAGLDRDALQGTLPAGAARNALDCALWDLEAKRAGTSAWKLAGLPAPRPVVTAFTVSLDSPEQMAAAARANAERPLLKLKLGRNRVVERVRAVRSAAPKARLIVDANEAWTPELLAAVAPELAALGVEVIEQPLPAGSDAALAALDRPVPVCADESCHDTASLDGVKGRYDMVNVKLDKTGGFTEALRLVAAARSAGFSVMVGCMVATSLAMAPASLITGFARIVDLDGPLMLERDRSPGLTYRDGLIYPPAPALWG